MMDPLDKYSLTWWAERVDALEAENARLTAENKELREGVRAAIAQLELMRDVLSKREEHINDGR